MLYRILRNLIRVSGVLITLYLIAALVLSLVCIETEKDACLKDQTIYVKTNGVHADIVIPVNYLSENFVQKLQMPIKAQFLSFGWGDKNFYLNTPSWTDLSFTTAFEALFMQSASVMHVTAYSWKNKQMNNNWKEVKVCQHQLDKIIRHIYTSFKDENIYGFVSIKSANYYTTDKFFDAYGSYNCFYTCNTWVVEGFQKANIPVAIWSPFDFGVLFHLSD